VGKTWGTVTGFLSFILRSEGSLCGQRRGNSEEVRGGHHLGLSPAVQPVIRPAHQLAMLQTCAASPLRLPGLTAKLCLRYYFFPLVSVSPSGEELREPQ